MVCKVKRSSTIGGIPINQWRVRPLISHIPVQYPINYLFRRFINGGAV